MKLKKKEKLKELQSLQQNEILRTLKMQENISKLNEFCKKNIQKQLQKKRNTTIQHQNNNSMKHADGDRSMINQTKISGRKIVFEKSKQIQQPHEIKGDALMMFGPDNEEDSSRLSTEFYEEYYRLLNSLKKDEQIPVHDVNESVVLPGMASGNISRANAMKSPATKSLMNQNKTTLIISPTTDANTDQPSAILQAKVLPKQSKSSLSIHQGRARSRLQKQMKINPSKIKIMKSGTGEQQKLLNINQILKAKGHKIKIPPPKPNDKNDKNKKSLKLSIKKKDNNGVILQQDIANQVPTVGNFEILTQKLDDSMERPMTDTELELLNIFINKQASKIQNAFRKHLLRNGFYNQPYHYEDIESTETVKREENKAQGIMVVEDSLRSKTQSVKTIVQKSSEPEIGKSTTRRVEEENASYDETVRKNEDDSKIDEGITLAAQLNANTYSEENEYDDEDCEEDGNNDNLIIINDQQFIDDDKKVVYLSNINSCSLPQTPKVDEQQITEENMVKNSELKKVCFDYIQKNGFILEQINNNPNNFQNFLSHSSSQLQDSFSQIHADDDHSNQESNRESQDNKNSVVQLGQQLMTAQPKLEMRVRNFEFEEEDKHHYDYEGASGLELADLRDDRQHIEEKTQDYQMRIFTGSESFLRELKMNTPKEHKNTTERMMAELNLPIAGIGSMTSQNSQSSLIKVNQQQQPQVLQASHYDSAEQIQQQYNQHSAQNQANTLTSATQSAQSIFDRNSFQQFTANKLQNLVKNNEFMHLIQMREKALDYRQEKERKYIKKMYKTRQFSPRTYTQKKEQLEKWVRLEQEEIQKSKTQFQEEWDKTVQMIEETQKNVEIMREQIRFHTTADNNVHKHHLQLLPHAQKVDLQSSRNSSASYASTTQKPERKSILDQEEFQPLSHRSNRMSTFHPIGNHLQQSSIEPLTKSTVQNEHKNDQAKIANNNLNEHPHQQLTITAESLGGNLIDFLEDSWKKSQQTQTLINPISSRQLIQGDQQMHSASKAGGGGILIQDQTQPEKEDAYNNSEKQSPESESQHIHHSNESPSTNKEFENTQGDDCFRKIKDEERPLMRSRSEQDLSELLKKTKGDLNNCLPIADEISEVNPGMIALVSNLDHLGEEELSDGNETSFRILDSERQNQNSQIIFGASKANKDEIRIQENLFEDSSNRQLSNQEYHLKNLKEQRDILQQDVESHDSLLNEQELNNMFQRDNQKFSIEDFKKLDKKNLLPKQQKDFDESESFYEDLADTHNQVDEESAPPLSIDDIDFKYNEEQSRDKEEEEAIQESQLNEDLLTVNNQPPSQFLFQNAKPGENIKISEILKKNAANQGHFNMNNQPYLLEESDQIKILKQEPIKQTETKNNETNPIESEKMLIAFEIAEDILQMLINQEVNLPRKIKPFDHTEVGQIEQTNENPENKSLIQPVPIQAKSPQSVPIPNPNENQDVFVVDTSMNEKEARRDLIEFKQRLLIEQDLQRIENYVNEVITVLQQHELNYLEALSNGEVNMVIINEGNFHRQFLQVLTGPIKRNQLELLNQLQTSEIGSYEHFETAMDISAHPILPVDLYLDIERQREEQHLRQLYQNNNQGDIDIESSVVQESVHIHNKAIFDALNESLMKFRPYGIQGEPMPWSNKVRRLQTKVDTNQVDTERLFFMVKQDVMRWSQNCIGCLPSQVFIIKRQTQENNIHPSKLGIPQFQENFDEELFQETRERRLAQLLASEVVETEHQWLNYEFEESQVKIDLSDMILEHLVEEAVIFLNMQSQNIEQNLNSSENNQFVSGESVKEIQQNCPFLQYENQQA